VIERVIDFLNVRDFWLKDGFEVIVLAFVFYRLLLLIKGTRAVQMVYGLIGLAFVYWITGPQLLAFETMNRLMLPLLLYVPFAIVVVFQNTIRRALTGFGANPFSRYLGSAQEGELRLSLVVSAAYALAARKIGGLIVLEREQGLRNWSESGITLDAAISYDLIVNVFSPYTPLHDGALIIGEGRLKAASCFLPLTSNPALSTQYGTRHRAAIGITEETDAIAIIISEEQGQVSLAIDGVIYEGMEKSDLKRRLGRALEAAVGKRRNQATGTGTKHEMSAGSGLSSSSSATSTSSTSSATASTTSKGSPSPAPSSVATGGSGAAGAS
jgi:diadenylate cyclase